MLLITPNIVAEKSVPDADSQVKKEMHSPLGQAITACVLGTSDIAALASGLIDVLTEGMAVDRGSLYLLDPKTLSLRSAVANGINRSLVVPLRIGVVGAAILQRRPLRVDDAYGHPFFNPDIDTALDFQTRSLLVAPILSADGKVLGGVELINKSAGTFTEDDESAAQACAQRIARWIETDKIYPAGVEAEAVATRRVVNCERASIFSLDDKSSRLIALYADGDQGRLLSLNMKLGIAGMVSITGQSVMLRDAWDDSRFDRSVDVRTGYRTRSMLCVPLREANAPSCGVIQLINQRSGAFSPAQCQFLEAASAPIARAIQRLYDACDER